MVHYLVPLMVYLTAEFIQYKDTILIDLVFHKTEHLPNACHYCHYCQTTPDLDL